MQRVAIIDDAFDPPDITNANAGAVLDFLEDAANQQIMIESGVLQGSLEGAIAAISESEFDAELLAEFIANLYERYFHDLDARFDPGGIFESDKASNLAYVRPLLGLLKKCNPPLQLEILGAEDDLDVIGQNTDLIFLDFYLNSAMAADQEGNKADKRDGRAASLERITQIVKKRADQAPSIVLMSSHSDVAAQAEKFRQAIGGGLVFASRFAHLQKKHLSFSGSDIEIDQSAADALLDIVQTYEFARALDLAMSCWLNGATKAVAEVRTDIGQLSLKELSYLVRFRLADEGQSLLEYLEWFFGECLLDETSKQFETNLASDERVKSVDGPSVARIEGAFDGPTTKIAELYHKVRISSASPTRNTNFRMGDLYLVETAGSKRLHAVVTPDCDLIIRKDGKRRAPSLLTVSGLHKAYDAADSSVSDFLMIGTRAYNITWNSKDVTSRPFAEWPVPGQSTDTITYVGTLRPQYAQALQRQVLDDLGRVGVSVAPALGFSVAAAVTIRDKGGKTSKLSLPAHPKASAYLVPGRNASDKPQVIFVRRFVSALIAELGKLDTEVYPRSKDLQKPEAYSKLQKMFQSGIRLEDTVDFGISVTAKKKPPLEIWCWIEVSLATED